MHTLTDLGSITSNFDTYMIVLDYSRICFYEVTNSLINHCQFKVSLFGNIESIFNKIIACLFQAILHLR